MNARIVLSLLSVTAVSWFGPVRGQDCLDTLWGTGRLRGLPGAMPPLRKGAAHWSAVPHVRRDGPSQMRAAG